MKGTLFAHCQSDKQGVYQLVGGKMANRPSVGSGGDSFGLHTREVSGEKLKLYHRLQC
jgi:hypothetical protein